MKENKKTIIFYFTVTGNSLYVAKEISKSFKQVDIVAIPQAVNRKEFDYEDYNEIGFVMPLYFMGMPVMVKDFIDKIHIPNATYIFSVVTRAYTKGLVFTEINKSLMKQGKNLNYGKYISFPDCYIRWDQAHDEESQLKVFQKATKQLEIIKFRGSLVYWKYWIKSYNSHSFYSFRRSLFLGGNSSSRKRHSEKVYGMF